MKQGQGICSKSGALPRLALRASLWGLSHRVQNGDSILESLCTHSATAGPVYMYSKRATAGPILYMRLLIMYRLVQRGLLYSMLYMLYF